MVGVAAHLLALFDRDLMASQISVSDLKKRISDQKKAALGASLHIFADQLYARTVGPISSKVNEVCKNKDATQLHVYSGTPGRAEVANCFGRVLMVCFVNPAEKAAQDYCKKVFPTYMREFEFADLRWIDVSRALPDDVSYIESLGIYKNPTVLAWKMGHIFMRYSPESDDKGPLSEIKESQRRYAEDASTQEALNRIDRIVKYGTDTGREEFENRQRKREIEAAKKKRYDDIIERRRVERFIKESRESK